MNSMQLVTAKTIKALQFHEDCIHLSSVAVIISNAFS